MCLTHGQVEAMMEKLRALGPELKEVMQDATSDDWKERYTEEMEIFYEVHRTLELLEVIAAPAAEKET